MSVGRGLHRLWKAGGAEGTTEMDWVRAMKSNPQSISELPNGYRLLQWRSGTYQIQRVAVMFDAQHRFVKITHRYQC